MALLLAEPTQRETMTIRGPANDNHRSRRRSLKPTIDGLLAAITLAIAGAAGLFVRLP